MTLFDPLSQISNVDALLEGGSKAARALETLSILLQRVLADTGIGSARLDDLSRLHFLQDDAILDTLDLPDGFRSTIAWLADLCMVWHGIQRPWDTSPRETDPAKITGIVLIDEIDLHLHARLQRELVPKLRKALPNVQFIVTTHSPLVLASFDRNELVVLDRDSKAGVRELDRQLFGLTMDQIYEWLMETPPESAVIEQLIAEKDPRAAALITQSPTVNEEEAEEKVARRLELMKRLHSGTT
jgi:predicted ATP-binding protein involved in virulence